MIIIKSMIESPNPHLQCLLENSEEDYYYGISGGSEYKMKEEELKRKGLEVMEEEMIDLKSEVSYAKSELESKISTVNFWDNEVKKARENLIIATKKYEDKCKVLGDARKLVEC